MGEVHARLAVFNAEEGLATGDELASIEAWALGAEELPHAASIRTTARPAPLMPSQTLARASPLLEPILIENLITSSSNKPEAKAYRIRLDLSA